MECNRKDVETCVMCCMDEVERCGGKEEAVECVGGGLWNRGRWWRGVSTWI